MSLFRYPGGKGKASKIIGDRLSLFYSNHPTYTYLEPFVGAASIGFELLKRHPDLKVWFNDYDPAIFAVWHTVKHDHEKLKEMIVSFTPSTESFFKFKKIFIDGVDIDTQGLVKIALMKIAIHQLSYSGLGTMSGVLGGNLQKSKYKVDCRYNPKSLCKKIDQAHHLFNEDSRISCLDFEEVINNPQSFLYVDPPYFEKGHALYQYSLTESDHAHLAACLKQTENPWLLSYDNHPEIIAMYEGWSDIDLLEIKCTINGVNKKNEVLISSRNFSNE